jgi:hypothetical protein
MLRRIFGVSLLLAAGLSIAWGPVHAQGWTNIRLNSDTSTQLQNEQQIVVNPTNPMQLAAIWRDFRLGYRQVGYGYSTDGGQTWTNPGLFVDPHYANDSDPALAVSATGTFYAMLLAYTGNTSLPNGMLCYRSLNGGMTWEERGFAINAVPNVFEDKELIACDRSFTPRRGRLYCVWDRFNETNIYCVASGDEGATWTPAVRVSNQSSNQFPCPAVGPDGTLYVAWTYYGGYLRLDKSTDGGATFGSDVNITSIYNPAPTLNGGVDAICSPALDVDITGGPFNGRLYVVYLNRVNNDYDIYIRHSIDHGATWSTARRINDDTVNNGRDQFHPWVTVDNTGTLSAVWLDRRQDPANLQWHCYMSQSTDGGMTWSANQQISTVPSDPGQMMVGGAPTIDYEADRAAKMARGPVLKSGRTEGDQALEEDNRHGDPHNDQDHDQTRAGVIGEYIGIASYDGYATPVWTDTRNGNQDTYAAFDAAVMAVNEQGAQATDHVLVVAPNPASGPVGLAYRVPSDGWVGLEVVDVNGRRIRTLVARNLRAGDYHFIWDRTDQVGQDAAAGTYYLRYTAPGVERSASVQVIR